MQARERKCRFCCPDRGVPEQHECGLVAALVGGNVGLNSLVEKVEERGVLGGVTGFCLSCSRVSMLASEAGLSPAQRGEHYARLVVLSHVWYSAVGAAP